MVDGIDLSAVASLTDAPLGSAREETGKSISQLGTLIVIEPRAFVRGCIICWLSSLCPDFSIVAEPRADPASPALKRAAAGLVGVGSAQAEHGWLANQVMALRAERRELPVILILEASELARGDALAHRLGVQGYIPASSTIAVAAAVLRLVIAGGTYFPAESGLTYHNQADDDLVTRTLGLRSARLTPREQAVLGVLASGAQNKIIAYQLGMSLSTVKAHVHSIINKLRVRNRTEVVVAARNMLTQSRQDSKERAHIIVPSGSMQAVAD